MKTFKELINGSQPVLVDFYAEWCGPCKMMAPVLKQVKTEIGEKAKIIKIDVDKNPQVSDIYGIRGVPTMILFKEGEIKWRQAGVLSAAQIKKVVEKYA